MVDVVVIRIIHTDTKLRCTRDRLLRSRCVLMLVLLLLLVLTLMELLSLVPVLPLALVLLAVPGSPNLFALAKPIQEVCEIKDNLLKLVKRKEVLEQLMGCPLPTIVPTTRHGWRGPCLLVSLGIVWHILA